MKKIDILNFITNHRKLPNDIKTIAELRSHLNVNSANEPTFNQLMTELQQLRVIRELEKEGQKAYQVVAR